MLSTALKMLPLIALTLGLSSSSATAARTSWTNADHYRARGTWYIRFVKQGSVWYEYQNNVRKYSFTEQSRSTDWMILYDSDRNIHVALGQEQCLVWSRTQRRWVTYYLGGFRSNRYRVTFERMKVHDDKEGGKGDWNVRTWITGFANSVTLIGNREAGTGQTLQINRTFYIYKTVFDIFSQVREHDGGIGAKWEYVGDKKLQVATSGSFEMRIRGNEGDVSLYVRVVALD